MGQISRSQIRKKLLALTVYKLLKNGGQEAKKIAKSYTPVFNKESYIQYVKNTIE